MKSEHRHQLETNDLSARLAQWIEKLKPYTGQITTAVLLLAVAYAGLSVWNAQTALRERAAWDAFALATDSSDPEMASLQRVAGNEEFAGTSMQEWALIGWADRQVLNAMQYALVDHDKTNEILTSVQGIYEQLANSAGDSQVLNRARFGLGRVYELQNKLDEAQEQYSRVQGDLQLQASERAKQLDSKSVREASAWLATAELPKRDLTGGQGASGARPDFDASLPEASGPGRSGITNESLDELLNNFKSDTKSDATTENRYGEEDDTQTEEPTPSETSPDESASAGGESSSDAEETSNSDEPASEKDDATPE